MKKWLQISIILSLFTVLILFVFNSKPQYTSKSISFTDKGDTLTGVINIPIKKNNTKTPLAIFVHGDGEVNTNCYGYYNYIWNALAKKGIASVSWSKKGIDKSSGNWLHQSMNDRAIEVLSGVNFIQKKYPNTFKIGFIGFSQAGWVVPKIANQYKKSSFLILVSGAINWKKQSNFLTKKRLLALGKTTTDINEAIKKNKIEFSYFNKNQIYKNFNQKLKKTISADRFIFIQKNINSDATNDLSTINCPTFGVFAKNDTNINSLKSYNTYKQILSKKALPKLMLKMYPNATHSLLKANKFKNNKPNLWFLLKLHFYSKKAFVNDFLNDISNFIVNSTTE